MMQMLLRAALAVLAAIVLSDLARSENAPPERLTIGYRGEGKVDDSPRACLAYVKEMTEWNAADTERGAKNVCAARKLHLDAYEVLQNNYKAFIKAVTRDRRLNAKGAVSNFQTLVKACIDHKTNLTTGGHNIMLDIIENDIAGACLTLGANLLKDETRKLSTP